MKIELHMIQNFPPSCLNRDDTNSPKDCLFGGVRRARISSQCIKRAIRWNAGFREMLKDALSIRSLRFPTDVRDSLVSMGVPEDIANSAAEALQQIAKKAKEAETDQTKESTKKVDEDKIVPDIFKTPQIAFYTQQEVRECARQVKSLLDKGVKPAELVKALMGKGKKKGKIASSTEQSSLRLPPPRTADIALFGRMITSDAFKNIDAACQVAHAISTNKVSMEMDFFTAVDDLKKESDDAGAGMMGVVGYNSACFYRYAVLDVAQLVANLGGDKPLARKTVEAFLRASAFAVPSGKQNTFAAHSRPDLISVVIRKQGAPLSMANAFVSPAKPGWNEKANKELDLTQSSVDALVDYWTKVSAVYGGNGGLDFCGIVKPTNRPADWRDADSLDALVNKALAAIDQEA